MTIGRRTKPQYLASKLRLPKSNTKGVFWRSLKIRYVVKVGLSIFLFYFSPFYAVIGADRTSKKHWTDKSKRIDSTDRTDIYVTFQITFVGHL